MKNDSDSIWTTSKSKTWDLGESIDPIWRFLRENGWILNKTLGRPEKKVSILYYLWAQGFSNECTF